MRRAARGKRAAQINMPAPVRGILEDRPPGVADPLSAEVVENYLPTQRGFKVRGGVSRAAVVPDAVVRLMGFVGASDALFAATADAIYDISSLSPTVEPAPSVSLMTSGDWSSQQIGTAGDNYLVAVNGADFMQVYDGGGWNPVADEAVRDLQYDALTADFAIGETVTGGTSGASATILGVVQTTATTGTLKIGTVTSGPFQDNEAITSAGGAAVANGADASASSFTISGVATDSLSQVFLYAQRLFFVEKDSLRAWYLPAVSIGGTAASINLAGVFRRGGTLVFGASWSADTGDGLDDRCIFVSSEGEVAVYVGTDPSSSSTWSLEGRYDIGKPVSKHAIMRAGGEVLIATDDGIVPVSEAVNKDVAALSLAAITRPIPITWANEVSLGLENAQLVKWTKGNLMLVVAPNSSRMLTVNLQTGAWAVQTGWACDCAHEYLDNVYVGRSDGRVYKINSTGTDDGAAFVARMCYGFNEMGDAASYKVATLARAAFYATGEFNYSIGVATDYRVTFPAPPSAAEVTATGFIWNVSNWNEAVWGGPATAPPVGRQDLWLSVAGAGFALAPTVQVTSGQTEPLDVEFVRLDLMVEVGGVAA